MARGMDVEGVTAVINYDPPANIKGYVHRVGRTARAGREGTSYTLLRSAEVHHFKRSMAKAGKAWRPLQLPRQSEHLDGLTEEYQRALDRLQWTLEKEKSGALKSTAPFEAIERMVDKERQRTTTSEPDD
jgi:ATP-dependent RNA helicase DDX51/DBP6